MKNNGKTVLIVDDNKDMVELLRDYFELYKSDFRIIGMAYNGIEALNLIKTCQPDIVVLDIKLPYINGIELLQKISGMDLENRPDILIMSGLNNNSVIDKAYQYGAVQYIVKPFSVEQLVTKISEL
jgi:two-component system response regulator (stage 0 sporulation protein A)